MEIIKIKKKVDGISFSWEAGRINTGWWDERTDDLIDSFVESEYMSFRRLKYESPCRGELPDREGGNVFVYSPVPYSRVPDSKLSVFVLWIVSEESEYYDDVFLHAAESHCANGVVV